MNLISLLKELDIKYWIFIILIIIAVIIIIFNVFFKSTHNESFKSRSIIENYSNNVNSNEITSSNDLKTLNGEVLFVKFYAPWCGHCQNLEPKWSALENKYGNQLINNKRVKILSANCDKYEKIGEKYNINGYPTIKLIKNENEVIDYEDKRELEDLQKFLINNI